MSLDLPPLRALGDWLRRADCRILPSDGHDDQRRCSSVRAIEAQRDREWSAAGERVPVDPRRGGECRQGFAIMPSVVRDVSARDFQQRIDSCFGRGSSGRQIVVQSSGRPLTKGFAKHHDSQGVRRHMLHIGARNANDSRQLPSGRQNVP